MEQNNDESLLWTPDRSKAEVSVSVRSTKEPGWGVVKTSLPEGCMWKRIGESWAVLRGATCSAEPVVITEAK
jgi:hypothetical protein